MRANTFQSMPPAAGSNARPRLITTVRSERDVPRGASQYFFISSFEADASSCVQEGAQTMRSLLLMGADEPGSPADLQLTAVQHGITQVGECSLLPESLPPPRQVLYCKPTVVMAVPEVGRN